MDLNAARELLRPFIELFGGIIAGGTASAVITEFLKAKFIPVPAQRYPRLVNASLSFVAALAALYFTQANVVVNSIAGFLVMFLGVVLVAAITYNNLIKNAGIPTQDDLVKKDYKL